MKRLSMTLVVIGLVGFASTALAQTGQSPAKTKPCAGDELPGRPTLKLHRPTADTTTTPPEVGERTPFVAESNEVESGPEEEMRARFEGLSSMSDLDALKLFRERGVKLRGESSLDPDAIRNAERVLREAIMSLGYRHASVTARIDKVDGGATKLVFVINEGQRFGISEIRFEGNRVFPSELLASEMREYLARFAKEGNAGYDELTFEYCLHLLNNFARSHGYLQAQIRDPKLEEVAGGLIVTLKVDEGVLYRVGKIEIDGANSIALEQVRAMLSLQSGDIANGEKVAKWLFEDLKAAYGERGFIQYTAEVTPEFNQNSDGSEGVVDFKIDVDEGRRFKLRRIFFEGEGLPEKELRQLVLIREGEIYNQSLFERSIDKLDDTGLFEKIDKDRDADFRTNEEEGLIDIVIKLTKRQN